MSLIPQDSYHYFLSLEGVEGEHEVTREQWIAAERRAGFRPKGEDRGQPATGGFSAHGVRGRIRFTPLDLSAIIEQAAENDAQRTHYEVVDAEAMLLTKSVLSFTLIVEPLIMAHFQDLVMDTEEDEALRHKMLDTLAPWAEAVQEFRAWAATR